MTNMLPPVPRDQGGPSESELIPFKSTKINIWKSKALVPMMLFGLAAVALFTAMGNIKDAESAFVSMRIFGVVGVSGIFLGIYYYSGERKSWWWYLIPAVMIYLGFTFGVFDYYYLLFHKILPGDVDALKNNSSFIPNFIAYFFGAGLNEELYKATPGLIAFFLARYWGTQLSAPTPDLPQIVSGKFTSLDIKNALALRGPLDGLLIGCAAGAAFILDETLTQYIVETYKNYSSASHDQANGLFFALTLLIPRIFQGVSGHMAWAGISGYFIGLALRYPSRAPQLFLFGWLIPAVLHGLWDSVGNLPAPTVWYSIDTIVTILAFTACLLKAKQLDMSWRGAPTSSDSILVGSPAVLATSSPSPQFAAAPAVAAMFSQPQPAPAPVPQPIPVGVASPNRFAIGIGTTRFALEAQRSIDFTALFGSSGVPPEMTGEITQHPQDPNILGLKNTGKSAWTAVNTDGSTVTVAPGKNLRIVAGTRLILGQLALDIQPY